MSFLMADNDDSMKYEPHSREAQNVSIFLQKFVQNRSIEDPTRAILLAFSGILIIIGTVGNALVVISVVRKPLLRTADHMYIANLAVAHLLVCCVGVPLNMMQLLTLRWPLPTWPILCKACGFTQIMLMFVSIMSITSIAWNRYQMVMHPTRRGSQTLRTIILVWVTAIIFASPIFIFKKLHTHHIELNGIDSFSFCIEDWPIQNGSKIYFLISLVFTFFLPILVVIIGHQLNKRLRRKNQPSQLGLTILIYIAVTYMISRLPLNVLNLVEYFTESPFKDEESMTVIFAICHMFVMFSAVANPLVYWWLCNGFRKEFEEILCCWKKRQLTKSAKSEENMETELAALSQFEDKNTTTKMTPCP